MSALTATPLVARTVRLFVQATSNAGGNGAAAVFDPSVLGRFDVTAPPAGWMDAGTVLDLKRDAETTFAEVASGTRRW